MGNRIVSCFKGVATVMTVAMIVANPVFAAEDRADVLERIKPIGQVDVAGQAAAPAVAEQAAPAADASEAAVAEAVNNLPATAAGEDPQAMATAKGCLACHQLDTKVVGPAYKEVAAKYKGDAGALDTLVKKVKAGGVGTWGQIPMPPQAAATDEEIKTIVQWVLSL